MKKLTIIVLTGLLALASCDSGDKVNPIEAQYFKVENGTYKSGQIPSSSVTDEMGSLGINQNAIPGGSSYLTITTTEPMKEFYIAVSGVSGYFVVPATSILRADDNAYSLLLLISQHLSQSFTLRIGGRSAGGSVFNPVSQSINYLEVGIGALQVSLSFNNDTDVDLYVVRPDDTVIYYGNKGGYDSDTGEQWGLDLDSNAGCGIDGINNENIFFPTSQLLTGKYEVWVNLWGNCNQKATTWAITATHNGSLIRPSFGSNPATGTFPSDAPSNSIGASRSGATKVMEFTISGAVRSTLDVPVSIPLPKSPSALLKEEISGKGQ